MRILFVNHVFPGIFGPLAAALAAEPGNEVLFASIYSKRDFTLPGVRHMVLPPVRGDRGSRSGKNAHTDAGMALNVALNVGRQSLRAFLRLRESGFVPDMVLAFSGEAAALYWEEAFPEAFRVSWNDGESALPGHAARGSGLTRHLLQCRQALGSDLAVSLTAGLRSLFDLRLKGGADLPFAVDTSLFSPGAVSARELPGPERTPDEVVIYGVGGHSLADDALPGRMAALLDARPHCHIFLLCGSPALAEAWAEIRADMPQRERLHLPGGLSLAAYRTLLRAARLLVIPHAGDISPALMLETMSCGTPVLLPGDLPASSLLQAGRDILLAEGPCPEPALLANAPLLEAAGRHARQAVLNSFDRSVVIGRQVRFLQEAWAAWRDGAACVGGHEA